MSETSRNFRFGIFIVLFSLLALSCEKENENEPSITKKFFNAPSIENAKQYFNQNSNYPQTIEMQAKSTTATLRTDWFSSKEKDYKVTPEQNVDILYTPIYLDTNKDVKAFIASTQQGESLESKIVFVLHKTSNSQNGLSAYVFVYSLSGTLELEYNFENGQSVPFAENTNGLQSKTTGCEELPNLTPEELLGWLAQCTILLDEVVVVAQLPPNTIDLGNSGSGGLDIPHWIQIDYIDNQDYTSNSGGTNPQVLMSNEVSATGFSISIALGLAFNSVGSQWLTEQTVDNQSLLDGIAQFLNENKERPIDSVFENVNPNQLPEINEEAVNSILDMIDFLMNNPNGNFHLTNSTDQENRLSFESFDELEEFLDNIRNSEPEIDYIVDDLDPKKITARFKFPIDIYSSINILINQKIDSNLDTYEVLDVISFATGFTFGMTWTQDSWDNNILPNFVDFNVYGHATLHIFVDGIGDFYTESFHYSLQTNIINGQPLPGGGIIDD